MYSFSFFLPIKMSAATTRTYIETAKAYAAHIAANPPALEALLALINQRGQEYFGADRDPYRNATIVLRRKGGAEYVPVYDKAGFWAAYAEDDEEPSSEEVAMDDSFRHTIFVNVTDMDSPVLVDVPAELMSRDTDWILTWPKVQEIPGLFPDGKTVAVHLDWSVDSIFIPIPTLTAGGRRRATRKTSTLRKKKGTSRKA